MIVSKDSITDRFLFLVATVFFFLTLVYSIYLLSFEWAYQGIEYHELSTFNIVYLLFLLIIPLFKFGSRIERPSDLLLIYLYFFVYAPYLIVPYVIIEPTTLNPMFNYYSICLLLCFLVLQGRSRTQFSVLEAIPVIKPSLFYPLLLIVYLACFLILFSTFGLSIQAISFTDVYDIRNEFSETSQSGSFAIGYIVPWFAYIINPFVLLLGLVKKNLKFIVTAIVFQLYIFTFSAFKSHLAIIILEIVLFVYLKNKNIVKVRNLFLIIGVFPVVILLLDFLFFEDNLVSMLITRRVIVVPGQLSYYYVDFFSTHPKNFLSYSIFKSFIDNPYTLNPPYLIGNHYYGKPQMAANAGFLPDAYGSFGFIGVFISAFIMKWVLNTIDFLYIKSNRNAIVLVMSLAFCYVLNTSALLTLFLTHGLLLLLLLLRVFPWYDLKKAV